MPVVSKIKKVFSSYSRLDISKSPIFVSGDLYQRQPLLPAPNSKWANSHPSTHKEYFGDDEDEIMNKSADSNGVIKINMPAPIREEPRFPQERWKTLIGRYLYLPS